jgi:hypothetical protein
MRDRNQIAADGPTDKRHRKRSETVDERIFILYLVMRGTRKSFFFI